MVDTPRPFRFRLPDRTPPFDVSVHDDGCVVCEGPASGRLYCPDHEPAYPAKYPKRVDRQTEAHR